MELLRLMDRFRRHLPSRPDARRFDLLRQKREHLFFFLAIAPRASSRLPLFYFRDLIECLNTPCNTE
jgi:hypothetical protein